MVNPPATPENPDHGAAPKPAKPTRPRRGRALKVIAVVLLLLLIAAQLSARPTRSAGVPTTSSTTGKSHVDEARGHLNAILHLFD